MSLGNTEIAQLIATEMEGVELESVLVQGGEGKYQVQITSDIFAGLNAVKRQQAVYRILNPHIATGAIHAVSMILKTHSENGTN